MYIREAHPVDGRAPMAAQDQPVVEDPLTMDERSHLATTCVRDLTLDPIPTLVDGLDDAVNKAYAAWPDRLYLIAKDGTVAYRGEPGPFGFDPDALGAAIRDVSLPYTKYAVPTYYIIAPAEASSNLARYDGVRYGPRLNGAMEVREVYRRTRGAGFGPEVRRRILIGTYVLSAGYYDAYYLQAQKVRSLIKNDFEKVFDAGIDVILTPATPSAAFGVAEQDMNADPVKMYLNDIFTVTVNMAGLPGIAVPAGLDPQGLPLALQLIGRPFDEETLFRTARIIESAAGRFQPEKWWA